MALTTPIYTDSNGVPFERPDPANYPTTVEWLRAFHAYKDAIADCSNRAFDAQLRKALQQVSAAAAALRGR